MRFNLSNKIDAGKAKAYLASLIYKGEKCVEITKKKKRTISQNSLLHLWLRYFAYFIGEQAIDYVKLSVVRAILGKQIRKNILTGSEEEYDYRTRDFTTEQLSDFLDKFHSWAYANYNVSLPYPGDLGYDDIYNSYIE